MSPNSEIVKHDEHIELPKDWCISPLKDLADIRFSNVDKKSLPGERDVSLCNYTDVYSSDYITGDEDLMSATAKESEIVKFSLEAGDVIITKDSETPYDIGVPAVVMKMLPDVLCGYHLALIRPKKNQVDPIFLAKELGHDRISQYFGRLANGLTRFGLTTSSIESTPIWIPPMDEQLVVSTVLRTMDSSISKTEMEIAKLKAIKQGLFNDLLTRGIDDNGELRDPEKHPGQFKDSSIGNIPNTWSVYTLGDLAALRIEKIIGAKDISKPYIGLEHIASGDAILLGSARSDSIISTNSVFYEGDILFGKLRPNLRKCVSAPFNGYCSTDILVLKPNSSQNPAYIAYIFQWDKVFRQAVRTMEGTKMPRTSWNRLKEFQVAIPPNNDKGLEEQLLIENTITLHNHRIESEVTFLSKLKVIKKGLMQDLLTGRVRVQPTRKEEVEI